MSNPAKTIFVFGIYLGVLGATLILAPNVLLGVFGIPATTEVWIRVIGVLVALLCVYYLQSARHELTPFFVATVYTRVAVIVSFTLFVLLGFAAPELILFGAVDLAGAIWTWTALRGAGTAA